MSATIRRCWGKEHILEPISTPERAEKTRLQIARVDEQLVEEFPDLPAEIVHHEVEVVSEELLASARFTNHVAVLTGRLAAEHLEALGTPLGALPDDPAPS